MSSDNAELEQLYGNDVAVNRLQSAHGSLLAQVATDDLLSVHRAAPFVIATPDLTVATKPLI